jgi:hypothetical protein
MIVVLRVKRGLRLRAYRKTSSIWAASDERFMAARIEPSIC